MVGSWLFFDLNKEVNKELFNGLVDWIIGKEPNYSSFGVCKLWIKKQNSQYAISKTDEKKKFFNIPDLSTYELKNK